MVTSCGNGSATSGWTLMPCSPGTPQSWATFHDVSTQPAAELSPSPGLRGPDGMDETIGPGTSGGGLGRSTPETVGTGEGDAPPAHPSWPGRQADNGSNPARTNRIRVPMDLITSLHRRGCTG